MQWITLLTKILHTLTLSTLKLPDSGKMDTVAQTSKEKKVREKQNKYQHEVNHLWQTQCGSGSLDCWLTTGLCDEVGEEVFVAVLFTDDCCTDERCHLINIMEVLGWGTNAFWQDLQSLFTCLLIAFNHLWQRGKRTLSKCSNWFLWGAKIMFLQTTISISALKTINPSAWCLADFYNRHVCFFFVV